MDAILYGVRAFLRLRRERRWVRLALTYHDSQVRPRVERGRWM
jgi:hypothetical protein